jgi:hypothetical protein
MTTPNSRERKVKEFTTADSDIVEVFIEVTSGALIATLTN